MQILCTKNFALPVSTAVYKILYQAVNAGSAVYKIFNQSVDTGSAVYKIVYPDIVYEVATAAIFIQTRGVQSVFSLENNVFSQSVKKCISFRNSYLYNEDKKVLWTSDEFVEIGLFLAKCLLCNLQYIYKGATSLRFQLWQL